MRDSTFVFSEKYAWQSVWLYALPWHPLVLVWTEQNVVTYILPEDHTPSIKITNTFPLMSGSECAVRRITK